jgi:hypothetical protein
MKRFETGQAKRFDRDPNKLKYNTNRVSDSDKAPQKLKRKRQRQ